ncbi:MAG: hypothetical protein ACLTDR_07475 [Adlercreutzia equolifaciens]
MEKLREKIGEIELRELFLEVYAYWVQLIMGAPPPHLFQDHGNLELLYARAGSLPR